MNFQLDYNTMNTEFKKLFVTYEIAKKLEELGIFFDSFGYYDDENKLRYNHYGYPEQNKDDGVLNAPLHQQVIDFLRENHKLVPLPQICSNGTYLCRVVKNQYPDYDLDVVNSYHNTYYEALESAILKALELIKTTKMENNYEELKKKLYSRHFEYTEKGLGTCFYAIDVMRYMNGVEKIIEEQQKEINRLNFVISKFNGTNVGINQSVTDYTKGI